MRRLLAAVLVLSSLAWAGTGSGNRPTTPLEALVKLNGEQQLVGQISVTDAGIGTVDAGRGEVVKIQCLQASCVAPGATVNCSALSDGGVGTPGDKVATLERHFVTLSTTNGLVSAAPQADAGATLACNVWRMR